MATEECQIANDSELQAEYLRLKLENRRRLWRRGATLGSVLVVAAMVEWRREIGATLLGRWYPLGAAVETVDVADAFAGNQAEAVILLDVRTPEEFRISHIRSALSLPLESLERDGWPED